MLINTWLIANYYGFRKKTVFQSIQSMQGMMPSVAMVTADSKRMPGDSEKLAVFKIKVRYHFHVHSANVISE